MSTALDHSVVYILQYNVNTYKANKRKQWVTGLSYDTLEVCKAAKAKTQMDFESTLTNHFYLEYRVKRVERTYSQYSIQEKIKYLILD
jgi:hypothetical protein